MNIFKFVIFKNPIESFKINESRYCVIKGQSMASSSKDLTKEQALDFYQKMLYYRRFEERVNSAYTKQKFSGCDRNWISSCHKGLSLLSFPHTYSTNYILLNLNFWIHVGFSTIRFFHTATWTEFQAVIGLSLTTVIVAAIPESHFFILCVKLEKQFSQNWIDFEGFFALDGFGTINHTHTTGPVVFLHRSSATKVIGFR